MTALLRTVLGEGFRVFFLAAAIWAVFAMLVWVGWLGVHAAGGMVVETPFAPAPHLWHAHEMIFGYAAAALGGFFLTAAPSWTGGPRARTAWVAVVAGLWLAGRLAMWWSGALPPALVAAIDLAFMPALGLKLGVMLMRRPQPRNLMLLALLALVWTGNLLTHLEWTGAIDDGAAPGLRMGLFAFAAVIAVIGGRVTPAFTRNTLLRADEGAKIPRSFPILDRAGIAAAIATPVLIGAGAPDAVAGAAALASGILQAARLSFWRGRATLRIPILWSLHLGYGMLALGAAAWGLSAAFGIGSEVAALHLLGIGGVGGMTTAVMSRASLGHAGRPLIAPRPVVAAYALIALAAITRAAGSSAGLELYNAAMLASGAMWIAAFSLFLFALGPILAMPRKRGGGAGAAA